MYILLKYWKELAILLVVGLISTVAYDKVYTRGYEKAAIEYELKIKEYNTKILNKITRLEDTSDLLVTQNISLQQHSRVEFEQIQKALEGKQLYTIVAGKCAPSKDFIDAWNSAIRKANGK